MLIDISSSSPGYIASPVSKRLAERFRQEMIDGGAGGKHDKSHANEDEVEAELFMQGWEDLQETLGDYIPDKKLKDLEEGYKITIRIDEWDFRHMLGYCAF